MNFENKYCINQVDKWIIRENEMLGFKDAIQ